MWSMAPGLIQPTWSFTRVQHGEQLVAALRPWAAHVGASIQACSAGEADGPRQLQVHRRPLQPQAGVSRSIRTAAALNSAVPERDRWPRS